MDTFSPVSKYNYYDKNMKLKDNHQAHALFLKMELNKYFNIHNMFELVHRIR